MVADLPRAKARMFLVVGISKDPTRVWPVGWSVDEDDCKSTVEICKAQAKAFVDELTPIWEAMEMLREPEEWTRTYGMAARRKRNPRYDHEKLIHDNQRAKLECDEHEINQKYRETMRDALFPTGNDGWCPEVDYVIWPLHEDMRTDLTAAELMLMRAKLHASEDEDAIYLDEDDDDD